MVHLTVHTVQPKQTDPQKALYSTGHKISNDTETATSLAMKACNNCQQMQKVLQMLHVLAVEHLW
jgi:hypothetical protein